MAGPAIRSTADPLARGRIGDVRLVRQHRRGNGRARDVLIERYLPLATRLASRYDRVDPPREDLVQVAALGLVKAADRWDPDRGPSFSSFAVPTIVGELRRHFRDATWDLRPPRRLQELSLAVERARDELHASTGHEATVADLAGRLRRSPEEVGEALLAANCRRLPSLETPADEEDDIGVTIADAVGTDDAGYEQAEARLTIARIVSVLDEHDVRVLRLRYDHDLLQSEIAERVGCSQKHVSRIIRKSINTLALQTRLAA